MNKENALIAFVVILSGILGITGFSGKSVGTDFASYYVSANIVRYEGAEKIYDINTFDHWRKELGLRCGIYRYPPIWAIMMVPYTYLSFRTALIIHQMILVIFLFFFWKILFRLPFPQDYRIRNLTLLASLFFSGTTASIRVGQIDIIIAFVYIYSLYLLTHDHQTIPAILLSVSSLIKISPVCAIIEFIKSRKRKMLILFIATVLLLILLFSIPSGLSMWIQYIKTLAIISEARVPSSLPFILSKISEDLYNLWFIIFWIMLALIWFSLSKDIIHNWALLGWLMFFITPITNPAYYIITIFSFYYFIQTSFPKNKTISCILIILMLLTNLRNPFYIGNIFRPWGVVIASLLSIFVSKSKNLKSVEV